MPLAVGIDLGTTYSCIAVYLNEEITVIPIDNDKDYMPTVVSFDDTGILVGDPAVEQAIVNSENTIFGIKRIIGRRYNEPKLQKFLKEVAYNVVNDGGKPKISVKYRGDYRLYDPESIYAMILKKLKTKTEVILGLKVVSAVITVPAFFSDSQKQATKDAGSLAGLNVLQILSEPTAVAICYGLDKFSTEEKYVLIYDFGSGMFDVSILKIKQGSTFETQATVGDTDLGSFELDSALVNYCARVFYKQQNIDVKQNKKAVKRLELACSKAKDVLSRKTETDIVVDDLMDGIDFRVTITRSKFEKLCEDTFHKTIELLHQVVIDSGIPKEDIDDVVLVGGASEIPRVRQLVSDYFDGIRISQSLSSDYAVVYGAAVRAAFLSGSKDSKIKNMLCIDVTPLSIGIETSGGIMTIVIEKGRPIPTKATYTITTHTDNQEGVAIQIYEGERALTCNNNFLGTLELLGLPPLPQGVPRIDVTFEIDSDGILTVSAEERSGMEFETITINLEKFGLSSEDITRMLKEANEFQEEDEMEKAKISHRIALENYCHKIIKAAFADTKNRLTNREKLEINKVCNEVREWLEQNPDAEVLTIIEKRNEAIKRLQSYASRLDQSCITKIRTVTEHESQPSTPRRSDSLEVESYKKEEAL